MARVRVEGFANLVRETNSNAIVNVNKNEFAFADGETITGTNSDSVNVTAIVNTTATGSAAQVEAGSYYINGFLVTVSEQTIVGSSYLDS